MDSENPPIDDIFWFNNRNWSLAGKNQPCPNAEHNAAALLG
jgi:hypothetical protein